MNPFLQPNYSPHLEKFIATTVDGLSNNPKLFEVIPNYNLILADLQNAFSYIESLQPTPMRQGDYKQVITLRHNEEFYIIHCQISAVNAVLKKDAPTVENLSRDKGKLYTDRDNLDRWKLSRYLKEYSIVSNPIVTAYYPYIRTELVIDGNHRMEFSRIKNLQTIPAYRLSSKQLFEIIKADKLSLALYTLHHNMILFQNLPLLEQYRSICTPEYEPYSIPHLDEFNQ